MTGDSRWYFPVFEGLIARKHVHNMGPALWLYLYLLSRAWVAQNGGQLEYSHLDAALALGRTDRTIKSWFSRLQKHGMIIRRARYRDHLSVQVQKWHTVEEWLNDRRDKDNGKHSSYLALRSEQRSEQRSEDSFTYIISILLSGYEYPDGVPSGPASGRAPELVCLADVFQDLTNKLRVSKNKAALLRQIYRLCFGGTDSELPAYSYIGKVARIVGGAGYLAKLMWGLTANRPQGNVLAYIQSMHKAKQRRGEIEKEKLPGPDFAHDGELETVWGEDHEGNPVELKK